MTEASFGQILDRSAELAIPFTLHISLTQRCDQHCVHCYLPVNRSDASLTLEELDDLLAQAQKAGTHIVTLSGGECTIRPDFFEIAEMVRAYHLALRIYTNGNGLGADACTRIARLWPLSVDVSLYGGTAEVHEAMTQVPGSFSRTTATIGKLIASGVRVRVKSPLTSLNIDDFPGIERLAGALGAELQSSPYLYPPGGTPSAMDELLCSDEQLHNFFATHKKYSTIDKDCEDNQTLDKSDRRLCGAGHNFAAIGPDGSVYPCPMFDEPVGNIRKARFAEIWKESPLLKKLRGLRLGHVTECRECDLSGNCTRCVAAVYSATKKVDQMDLVACRLAKIIYISDRIKS